MPEKSITSYPDAPDIESSTTEYARRFSGPVGQWLLEVQGKATTRLVLGVDNPNRDQLRVLDVGGGHGQNIKTLLAQGHELTIFGSDESCAGLIQDEIEKRQVKFDTGALLTLPYPDDSFDVVVSYRTLSHMVEWEKLVAELCRVASDSVIIDYPATASFNLISGALFQTKKRIEKNTRYYITFRHKEIEEAFAKTGFSATGKIKQFFFPMVLHRVLGIRAISVFSEKVARYLGLTRLFGSPVIAKFSARGSRG